MIATTQNKAPDAPVSIQQPPVIIQTPPRTPTHEEIAVHAYGIYAASGWVQGRSLENWLAAERSFRGPHPAVQHQDYALSSPDFPGASKAVTAQSQRSRAG